MTWTFEEDYLVCEFFMEHTESWKDKLDYLMSLLQEHGFRDRDKASVRMRLQNYVYLHQGNGGLSNVAKQSRDIYSAIKKRWDNPVAYSLLQGYLDAVDFNTLIKTPSNIDCYLEVGDPPGKKFNDLLWDFLIKSGLKESQVYNSCNMGRDTFSSIINQKNSGVTKKSVIQLCFGLQLSYEDSLKLLGTAGFTLSDGEVFDYVIACYLQSKHYDIHDVNITLHKKGVPDSLLLLQRNRRNTREIEK